MEKLKHFLCGSKNQHDKMKLHILLLSTLICKLTNISKFYILALLFNFLGFVCLEFIFLKVLALLFTCELQ